MKGLAVTLVTIGLAAVWGGLWRVSWLNAEARAVEQRIRRNRAKPIAGMTVIDEALRDRTASRREEEERALIDFRREWHNRREGKTRLHLAS